MLTVTVVSRVTNVFLCNFARLHYVLLYRYLLIGLTQIKVNINLELWFLGIYRKIRLFRAT